MAAAIWMRCRSAGTHTSQERVAVVLAQDGKSLDQNLHSLGEERIYPLDIKYAVAVMLVKKDSWSHPGSLQFEAATRQNSQWYWRDHKWEMPSLEGRPAQPCRN